MFTVFLELLCVRSVQTTLQYSKNRYMNFLVVLNRNRSDKPKILSRKPEQTSSKIEDKTELEGDEKFTSQKWSFS